jgi:hypothetical protein
MKTTTTTTTTTMKKMVSQKIDDRHKGGVVGDYA